MYILLLIPIQKYQFQTFFGTPFFLHINDTVAQTYMDSEIDRTTETRESAVEMDSSNFEAEIPQNNNPEEIDQHKIDLETLIGKFMK